MIRTTTVRMPSDIIKSLLKAMLVLAGDGPSDHYWLMANLSGLYSATTHLSSGSARKGEDQIFLQLR